MAYRSPYERAAAIIGDDPVVSIRQAGLAIVDIKALRAALRRIGDKAQCKGCGADIWWLLGPTGIPMPLNSCLESHFAECVAAHTFKGGVKE